MLVDSYLNSRTQFVRCGEKESSVGRVTCGVQQGSVLGPPFRRLLSTASFIFMRMTCGIFPTILKVLKVLLFDPLFVSSRQYVQALDDERAHF
jgi:hypothetical protein